MITSTVEICIQQLDRVEEMVFTARRRYARPTKKDTPTPPNFWPLSIVAQTAGWIKMPHGTDAITSVQGPRRRCGRWGRSSLLKRAQAPSFRFMSIVAKRLDG